MALDINGLVSSALAIVKGISPAAAPTITFRKQGNPGYNPSTGGVVDTTTDYPVTAVLARFDQDEIDTKVVIATDQKCLIAAKDLPVVPETHDQIVDTNSIVWQVCRNMGVPGNSLYILHIRRV